MFALDSRKIYLSIKFNNERDDDVRTTFVLFTSQMCVCVFFCNFYITPYFSNTYSDETYLFFWFHRTDLTYIFSCSDSKINLMKIKDFCMLLNLMVNLLQPVLWWTVDSSILRNISKKADEETLEILVQ